MYTEPKIITSESLSYRSYILYYFNGERCREYNGNKLHLKIFPNRATSLGDKNRLLRKLQYEFKKALEDGWSPLINLNTPSKTKVSSIKIIEQAFSEILNEKLSSPLSTSYKRELKIIHGQFISFLSLSQRKDDISTISVTMIEDFLQYFKSSGTYYMNKRRTLAVFFSAFKRKRYLLENLMLETPKMKAKASLHLIYSKEEIKPLLDYLKIKCPNLYLCCLLAYGCLLRPHQEIRQLKRKHIDESITQITLSGSENKSANIRIVQVPTYVKIELQQRLFLITEDETNIISLCNEPYNEDYFSTQWTRLKKQMLKLKLLRPQQTIYSFRHTAAVDIYTKTKDLYLLKELLGHSDMLVTLKYLRGLGVSLNENHKGIHAELP